MNAPNTAWLKLRPAIPSDLESLIAIDARCFPAGIVYSRQEIAALLRARDVLTIVAQSGQAIIGFASLRVWGPGSSVLNGELVTLDVLPEYRRRHVGRRLYQAVEETLGVRSSSRIELHVAVSNAAAIRFYLRFGYRYLARVPNYYPGAVDAWRMEKILS